MPLKKNKVGSNMYPWVSHMHASLGGECPHKCQYCYVNRPGTGRPEKYTGPLRLIEDEFRTSFGNGNTIFIEYMNDLWAKDVPDEMIKRVLAHCCSWPDNTYVFQTKNPDRYRSFFFPSNFSVVPEAIVLPKNCVLGITIETNRIIEGISEAPTPEQRYRDFIEVCYLFDDRVKKFVTIEPVLAFDVNILAKWIADIKPDFINLGADSKSHGLPEPTVKDVMALVAKLQEYGIELREKHNLKRLKEE
jgi:DNA repair photolyase